MQFWKAKPAIYVYLPAVCQFSSTLRANQDATAQGTTRRPQTGQPHASQLRKLLRQRHWIVHRNFLLVDGNHALLTEVSQEPSYGDSS